MRALHVFQIVVGGGLPTPSGRQLGVILSSQGTAWDAMDLRDVSVRSLASAGPWLFAACMRRLPGGNTRQELIKIDRTNDSAITICASVRPLDKVNVLDDATIAAVGDRWMGRLCGAIK